MKLEPLRAVRYYYLRFTRLQGDPHFLARGVAIGIFIGITPTIPLHTVLVLALAFLLRGSKIAAVLLTWVVSNPFTLFFQYYFSWRLGTWMTFTDLSWEQICSLLNLISSGASFQDVLTSACCLGRDTILVMLAGGTVLALPFTVVGYLLTYFFFTTWQKRVRKGQSTNRSDLQNVNVS